MNTNTYEGAAQHTATIIQFPAGGRRALGNHRNSVEALAEAMPQHICDALDNCWYHDDAIRHPDPKSA